MNPQIKANRRASSGALRQIQCGNIEDQPATKGIFGPKDEQRKSTYTVCKKRKPSVFEIPDIDERLPRDNTNRNDKDLTDVEKGKNHSKTSKSGRRLSSATKEQTDANDRNFETVDHVMPKAVTSKTESDVSFSMSRWKFKHGGETLHLDSVSSSDSIYCRMEALRAYLENELGTNLLTAVYYYVISVSLEKNEVVKERVKAMLGEDKMTYYPVLLQLIACEAIYFRSS